MTSLPLTRSRSRVLDLIADATASLERDVRQLLQSQDERLAHECAIFVYWSVHVGIVNAQTSALDSCIARLLLHRQLRRAARASGHGNGEAGDLVSCYEQRCREALATTPNIFLYQRRGADIPTLPVTPSGAKLFLRKIGQRRPPPETVHRLVELLSTCFWSCVRQFQPLVRSRFP